MRPRDPWPCAAHEGDRGDDGPYEADQIDLAHGVGWSVLVTGTVHIAQRAVTTDPVHRWFSDGVVLAMDTDVIVGHRASA